MFPTLTAENFTYVHRVFAYAFLKVTLEQNLSCRAANCRNAHKKDTKVSLNLGTSYFTGHFLLCHEPRIKLLSALCTCVAKRKNEIENSFSVFDLMSAGKTKIRETILRRGVIALCHLTLDVLQCFTPFNEL
ncbi:hypothetical protein TNCT_350781 [Trichonephila clavata]|uniref:Uncharacterized protein n=1 Tax=Trichonephila clavata TaxID=2740835 RepID=A0A8X6IMV7_TRICU|nr:hypothetical protein TNCT_384821 [Trichonephila clavata]GFQ97517.1 hypothetical protein TNCT_350781 [Trichonephila clavata]